MKRVAVIGGGLAGTSCAYVLKLRGFEPVIYEAVEIASGASGNEIAMYNPRLSAERTEEAEFYATSFWLARRTFETLSDIGWNKCGSLHLMTDEKRRARFEKCAANWGWPQEHMRIVDACEASVIAGVEVAHKALWLPDAGSVNPKKLCAAYARGIEIKAGVQIDALEDISADAIVLACGMGVTRFAEALLKAVRGQITYAKSSAPVKANICYGGYMTPAATGVCAVGATFQRWLDHADVIAADDADNIAKLGAAVPALAGKMEIVGNRAGVRATTPGHFPVVGALRENLFVSAGHGSHGVITSIAAAHLIADMISGAPRSLPAAVIRKLEAGLRG